MKIAFNAQRLRGQSFGVGRYIEYMIHHWSEMLEPQDRMTVFLRSGLKGKADFVGAQVECCVLPPDLPGLAWENLRLPSAASRHDVLFCPAYSSPLLYSKPIVLCTHSVNETSAAAHTLTYSATYGRLYQHCARQAKAVIVPSYDTREAVVEHYRVKRERVHVVHQGADDSFRPDLAEEVLVDARVRHFGRDRPYVLFVGKGSPRRNIPMLIEAFAKLKRATPIPHGLLLFGPYFGETPLAELCSRHGVAGDVVQTDGHVTTHAELAPIYAAADVFVHPSENEGWSMTTVEAMACGVAVIAADRGGLGEVARGAAYMLDQLSADALAAALRAVLTDPLLRQDLRVRARARGEGLRWNEIARRTLDIVKAVGREAGS